MYVDIEYALKVGKWLIDTALPDDNVVNRDNLRNAFYKAFENRLRIQAVTDEQTQKGGSDAAMGSVL